MPGLRSVELFENGDVARLSSWLQLHFLRFIFAVTRFIHTENKEGKNVKTPISSSYTLASKQRIPIPFNVSYACETLIATTVSKLRVKKRYFLEKKLYFKCKGRKYGI